MCLILGKELLIDGVECLFWFYKELFICVVNIIEIIKIVKVNIVKVNIVNV